MTAVKELLINGLMTRAAIGRAHSGVDHKTIVIPGGLALRHLVTIQTIKSFPRMGAHFELVDDRELRVQMTFGALAARSHEGCTGLLDDHARPARINEISRHDHRGGDSDGYENPAEIHAPFKAAE